MSKPPIELDGPYQLPDVVVRRVKRAGLVLFVCFIVAAALRFKGVI
jgi:hypothetical protein